MLLSILPVIVSITVACATTTPVIVRVERTTFVGNFNASLGIDEFLGVKYGTTQRFKRATPVNYTTPATIDASHFGVACPQIPGTNALAVDYGIFGTDEDCTLMDIYRPHDFRGLLPVMVWLHGGALTQGAASHFPGTGMVNESSSIGLPVIQVSINYRLAAWGFLGGKEVAANGALNLGLYDQKAALQWIQKYISAFGGDKDKVTVFGQSSGAMSITYHMLDVNQELFRGAILASGTSTSVPALAPEVYQNVYDGLVSRVGCSGTPNTFECLRTAPRDAITNASIAMFGQPEVFSRRPFSIAIDGDIIPASPSVRTAQGRIAKIPFITGNVVDEGTVFVNPRDINTTEQCAASTERDYIGRNATFFTNLTSIAQLELLYPADPALGSPFGTGDEIFFGTQFKRTTAIYGDIHFQYARRNFLDVAVSNGVKSWSYIFNQRNPADDAWQGVFHTAEIPYVFRQLSPSDGALYDLSKQVVAYWVSFAHNLDPAYSKNPQWDGYSAERKNLQFTAAESSMVADDFRNAGTDFIGSIADQFLQAKK